MSLLAALAPLALPFGLTLAGASLLRLAGGGGVAGVALPAGFLAAWALVRGLEVAPADVLGLAPHVALGGALWGLGLDLWRPPRGLARLLALLLAAGFGLVCLGATALFPLHGPAPGAAGGFGLRTVLLLAAWAVVLGRLRWLDRAAGRSGEAVAVLAGLAGGLALVAAAAAVAGITGAAPGAAGVARPALGLAAAALALGVPGLRPGARPTGDGGLGWAGLLGGGGAVLALGQGVALTWPSTLLPLAVLGLALFAGPTARRLPGGGGAAAAWTLLLALSCGGLAALVMLASGTAG
jgi:hypothetical protein